VLFFREISKKLFERSQWMDGKLEDVFADCHELSPAILLAKAAELGISPESCPSSEDLVSLLDEVTGKREGLHNKRLAYRCITLTLEGQAQEQMKQLSQSMSCLSTGGNTAVRPKELLSTDGHITVFGLAAFEECVLKLGLHRLSFKGNSNVQRAAPAWWKCTWLLTLLQGSFSQSMAKDVHEKKIAELAAEGNWEDAFSDTIGVGLPRKHPMTSYVERNASPSKHNSSKSSDGGSSSKESVRRTKDRKTSSKSDRDERESVSGDAVATRTTGRKTTGPGSVASENTPMVATRSQGRRNSMALSVAGTSPAGTSSLAEVPLNGKLSRRAMGLSGKINTDAEVWWRKLHMGRIEGCLPWNMAPLTSLAMQSPHLFEGENAEAQITHIARIGPESVCPTCNEKIAASGWGNPSCSDCNCVEDICLPMKGHIFADLLNVQLPQPLAKAPEDEEIRPGSAASIKTGVSMNL